MRIMGIESSGLAASVAVVEDGLLKGEFTLCNKLTHSETLLPMLKDLLGFLKLEPEDMDAIAVSAGPGSFTGLRIGAATAKGLALAANRPIVRISSLSSLAFNCVNAGSSIVCPIMDARRGQVYTAAFQESLEVIPEQACSIQELVAQLNDLESVDVLESERTFLFLGDGVPVHEDALLQEIDGTCVFVSAENNRQRAASAAELGRLLYRKWLRQNHLTAEAVREMGADAVPCFDDTVMNSDEFVPDYLRKPQAERELESGQLEDAGLHSLKKMEQGGQFRQSRRRE